MNKIILAGMLSCSNMGQIVNPKNVELALKYPPKTIGGSIEQFCAAFMETNEHERIFYGEGRFWQKELAPLSDETIEKRWPDIVRMYREKEAAMTA